VLFSGQVQFFQDECTALMKRDYDVIVIQNTNGQYCGTYPPELVILTSEKNAPSSNTNAIRDSQRLQELFKRARFSRVRARFPVPVILFNGKNVCRSSTLSQKLETVLRTATHTIAERSFYGNSTQDKSVRAEVSDRSRMSRVRSADIELIRALGVSHICDLMTENVRKKYGLTICSSEKNDSHKRYADFNIFSMPYPGVEFFRDFDNTNPTSASKLCFDLRSISNHAALHINYDRDHKLCNWSESNTWDIVTLTQNYVKLLLYILCEPNTRGLLIHCISGWDRTPMFISLLRLSLWADGVVHKSLSAKEILYLTIAYDWMLFRHQLVDRQSRGEDIFCFCFHVLSHLKSKEFSVHFIRQSLEITSTQSFSGPSPVNNGDPVNTINFPSLPRTAPKAIPPRRQTCHCNNKKSSPSEKEVTVFPFTPPIVPTPLQPTVSSERITFPEEEGTFGSWQLMTKHSEKTTVTLLSDNTLTSDSQHSSAQPNEYCQQCVSELPMRRIEWTPQTEMYNRHVWETDNDHILCFDDFSEFALDSTTTRDEPSTNSSPENESCVNDHIIKPSTLSPLTAETTPLVTANLSNTSAPTSRGEEKRVTREELRQQRLDEVQREFDRLHKKWIAPEREKYTKNSSFWSYWFR
jgi:myotubularin-related protein 14